ncbi:MAG: TonB-dependent receptor [Polyangiaceae bacterium]|nr:TonB-dependent receptor [Polyangiaceae bacterium]
MKVKTLISGLGALGSLVWPSWALAQAPSADATAPAAESSSEPGASVAKPAVKMPVIQHFEQAPYPPEALAQGLTGEVVLKLTIGVDGKVSAAEVATPAGHGFDEAAQAAALKFHFSPAERNGVPVPVQILYKYAFTLQEQEVPAAEVAAPTVGNLGGKILIADSEVPLAGVKVKVIGPGAAELEALTDASGKWELTGLAPGAYKVAIEAPGFQPFSSDESVVAGEATEATYRVAAQGEGLEVTVVGERPPREVTRRTLARREIARIPGTNGDALRSIQSLPGVARPPGLAGLLIVRGSAPQDTLTFINGTEVPLIYHFGGLSSVIPTELLEKIDFYPGNFSARYGLAQGGIVDVEIARPNTKCKEQRSVAAGEHCYHGLIQSDLIDNRFILQGPVGASKTWSFAAGGRRSWVDVWLKPVLEEAGASVTSAPVYHDYQLILHNQADADTSWRLQAYGADDELKLIINDPSAQDPGFGGSLTLSTGFYQIQSIYEDQLTRNVRLESMFAVGQQTIGFSLGSFLFDLKVHPVTLRNEFGFQLNRGMTLNVGMDFALLPFEVTVRAPPPPNPGEPDPGPFASRPSLETYQKSTGFRPGWYTEFEWQATEKLRLVPSMRFDYARDSGQSDVSPRLNARYELTGKTASDGSPSRQTFLKGGVGIFHQPPQFQETDPVFGTPGLESNRSIHYALGVERELLDQLDLSVEGFYKDKRNLVSRAPDTNGTFRYDNEGAGYAMGLETLLKYRADARFFGWVAYTLSRSVLRDRPEKPERLFEFDQTHNLTVLGNYQLGRGWEFGARFRVISGNLATPVVQQGLPALYSADAAAYAPLQADLYSRRLPLFHQLDLRLDKMWKFDWWAFSTYLDVQNAYNNQAVEALVYNYNFSQESYQTGLPLIPNIGVRGEF